MTTANPGLQSQNHGHKNTPERVSTSRRLMLAAGLIALSAGAPVQAAYPEKPIRLVVPFAAGGSATSIARLIADEMAVKLGTSIIVDNRGGAAGGIGATAVARAEPDGYTLLFAPTGVIAVNPALYKNLNYSMKELVPVSMAVTYPLMLFVNTGFPADDMQTLVAYAKANPGKVTFGSAGYGSSGHLLGELLKRATQTELVHVPYKGGGPAMMDVIGGQISMMMEAAVVGWPHVEAGKLKPIGVSSRQRLVMAPNVPSFAEGGVKDFDASSWYGVFAPTGTPDDVVNKLREAVSLAVNDPKLRPRIEAMGMSSVGSTSAEFAEIIRADTKAWADVVKAANITVD